MNNAPAPVPFDQTRTFARLSLAGVALLFVVGYALAAGSDALTKGAAPVWGQNADQALYWRSAVGFWHGDLSTSEHWYPPLYSLIMAPLVWAGEARAQFVVGLGLFLAAFTGFATIARHFGLRPLIAPILFALGTFWLDGMYRSWVWPWSTSLSGALILWGIALTLNLRLGNAKGSPQTVSRSRELGMLGLLGAVLAAIPCARPVDGLVCAILGLFAAWRLLVVERDFKGLLAIAGGGLLVLLPFAALYLAIWGPAASPYARMSAAVGFDFGQLGWKAYLLLVEPQPWYPNSVALLDRMPWLLLGGAGLIAGLWRKQTRLLVAITALPLLAYCLPMICYRAIVPSGLWLFGIVHYFKWALLVMILLTWQFVAQFRTSPRLSAACLAVLFGLSCISFRPVVAAPNEPARMLIFQQKLPLPDVLVYMGETKVIDRAGSQRNFFDIQAMPAGDGTIKVLAQARDFAGDESIAPDVPRPGLVRTAKGARIDGFTSTALYGPMVARVRPQMTIGIPCWLPAYSCPARELPPPPAR